MCHRLATAESKTHIHSGSTLKSVLSAIAGNSRIETAMHVHPAVQFLVLVQNSTLASSTHVMRRCDMGGRLK